MDLSGSWSGYYDDPASEGGKPKDCGVGSRFPISAELQMTGRRISGSMVDHVCKWATPIETVLRLHAPLLPERDREQYEAFAAAYPRAVLHSNLPPKSELSGGVSGVRVRFTKAYKGDHVNAWDFGDGRRVETLREPGHTVEYQGQILPGGNVIEGVWRIYRKGWFGKLRRNLGEGTFRLERG